MKCESDTARALCRVVHSRGAGSSARDTRRPSRDWFSAGILAVIHPGVGAHRSGQGPWHDREISAETLPFGDGTLGALVLFDVLHHLLAPGRFFPEATRVLRTGGRVIMCESYVGPFSYPVCTSSCTTSRWTWVSTPAGTGCGVRARPLRFEPSYPDIALRPRPGRLSAGFFSPHAFGAELSRVRRVSTKTASAVAALENLASRRSDDSRGIVPLDRLPDPVSPGTRVR